MCQNALIIKIQNLPINLRFTTQNFSKRISITGSVIATKHVAIDNLPD